MLEACAAVLADVRRLDPETARLHDALGRVLAEPVTSPLALPPWDNASMDGYAVRADDIRGASTDAPVGLTVVDSVGAGGATSRIVQAGEAVRIMTGAPMPGGADSVVRVEDTDGGETRVHVSSDRDAMRNVRLRGEDLGSGDVAVPEGTPLHAAHIGVLASVGRAEVRVVKQPRVAILASGDELVDVDRFHEVLAGNRIVSSNTYALAAAVRAAGGVPIVLGITGDDPRALRQVLGDCDCDLLLTTGGVSVGAFDFTRGVLTDLGVEHRFWRVRMRPGAPVGFGILRGMPWLGLPGNPVSTLVTFELFARPAIRKMLGHGLLHRRLAPARLAEAVTISAPLMHFLRVVVTPEEQGLSARLTGPQGSGILSSMARANGLLVVPPEQPHLEAGTHGDVMLLQDDTGHGTVPLSR